MEGRQNSASSSSASCDCCQCNSQICSSYLIGILASILIISGVFLAFHRWDYAWLIISLIGMILMLIGSVLYFCGSNSSSRRQLPSAKPETNHVMSPSAPALDPQSRSVSQLSLNMLPPYFPAFDTISMTSHLASPTTPSIHTTVSQILNINGQAFLMLPLATTSEVAQDTSTVGTKASNSESTQISINSSMVMGSKSLPETHSANVQASHRDSICAVTPLFVTLPPIKKEMPLQNMSPDVLVLTDAMLGRRGSENPDKAAETNVPSTQLTTQSSIGIQVETNILCIAKDPNTTTSCNQSVPAENASDAISLQEEQRVTDNVQEVAENSSDSSLQLSDEAIMEETTINEPLSGSSDHSNNLDSGIGDPTAVTDTTEPNTTDLDVTSEMTDETVSLTVPLVFSETASSEVMSSSVSAQCDVAPCGGSAILNNVTDNISETTSGTVNDVLAFPSTSRIAGTDCEPLLPSATSQQSLCDTDDELFLERSSSPPPSYEEVARDSNHSNAEFGVAYGTI